MYFALFLTGSNAGNCPTVSSITTTTTTTDRFVVFAFEVVISRQIVKWRHHFSLNKCVSLGKKEGESYVYFFDSCKICYPAQKIRLRYHSEVLGSNPKHTIYALLLIVKFCIYIYIDCILYLYSILYSIFYIVSIFYISILYLSIYCIYIVSILYLYIYSVLRKERK